MLIDLVVGCRPNFVKAAAILEAAKEFPRIRVRLLHTSQHNAKIADPLFEDLGLPAPNRAFEDYNLYGPHVRLGRMIADLSLHFGTSEKPDYVMVVGDTDSTLAGAIAAKKNGLKLVHVEAGLRCGDDNMQEEINRKAVDSISDIMYATTQGAKDILIREGHTPWLVKVVGNVMADTLLLNLPKAVKKYPEKKFASYGMLTLHRAENVNNKARMDELNDALTEVCKEHQVIFPIHPRYYSWENQIPGLWIVPPMGYLEFIATMARAKFVITDSGGVQEETTILGVPCFTIRDNTERPETCHQGTNTIVGTDGGAILAGIQKLEPWAPTSAIPPLWEGKAAVRILKDLSSRFVVASAELAF